MFYDPIWDKQHEECGVLGIYDKHLDIPRYIYWGLFALQHRGQESGGIALTDGQDIHTFRGMGLISTYLKKKAAPSASATSAIRRQVPIIPAISSPWPYTRLWDSWHWLITAT